MNIGEAAERSGLTPKSIRYYESIALVVPARRANGYRDYSESDVSDLHFVQQARQLGFSTAECHSLLNLYQDTHRASADVRSLANQKLQTLREQRQKLEHMIDRLETLVADCPGDAGPSCPIIDGLSSDWPVVNKPASQR